MKIVKSIFIHKKLTSIFLYSLILSRIRPSKRAVIRVTNPETIEMLYILAQLEAKKDQIKYLWSVLKKSCTWQEFVKWLIWNGFFNVVTSLFCLLLHVFIFHQDNEKYKKMVWIQDIILFLCLLEKPFRLLLIFLQIKYITRSLT